MHLARTLLSRIGSIFRRGKLDRDLDDELQAHIDLAVAENLKRGMTPRQARTDALRSLGGLAQTREAYRTQRGLPPLEAIMQDIRFGMRQAIRSRSFTITVLATLALGIGATTAIFSVVDAVLLRPLPYRDPQRLVSIFEDSSGSGLGLKYDYDTPGGYADFKRQTQIFEEVVAIDGGNVFSLLADGGEPLVLTEESVTWNLFPMLGVRALYGRVFTQDEDQPGHEHVVLLSYRLWQQRFGGDRQILGHAIRLDNRRSIDRYTVIGVMPPHFAFPEKSADIWIPRAFTLSNLNSHGEHYLAVVAKLKPGVTLARANADLQTLAYQARRLYPYEKALRRFFAEPLQRTYTRDAERGLWLLMAAVALILLIACANVANLLLSRTASRQREIGMRVALGASRERVIRQLLTESALLGACGSALGIAIAWPSFTFLKKLIPADLSPAVSLSLNLDVLGFVLIVSLTSSILFGLTPALRLSRNDVNTVLKAGAKGNTGLGHGRLGSALAAAEITLCLLLLTGAGLLLKSFFRLRAVDPGFRSDHVLDMGHFLKFPPTNPNQYVIRMGSFARMLDKVRALPGVKSAGFTSELPLGWAGGRAGFFPEGGDDHGALYGANDRVITPGYFETLRIPLVRGRFFDEHDGPDAPAVVIVNQTMARAFWPNQDPLGKRLKFGGHDDPTPWAQIVGIVGDVRQVELAAPPGPEMFFPYWQARGNYMTPHHLVVRAEVDPVALASAVRHAIQSVDPDQPADEIYPLDDIVDADVAPRRLQTSLLGGLAILALVIACIGIYGVMAYLVSQRTQEMGIRMALGAQRGDVLLLVLQRGATLAIVGIVAGIGSAAALMQLMRSFLFEVSPFDPLTFIGVSVLLLLVALVACVLPARRAASTDPMQALRAE